jgi:hypothetical protein
MCAIVRLRALMARQAARLITNPPIGEEAKRTSPRDQRSKYMGFSCNSKFSDLVYPVTNLSGVRPTLSAGKCFSCAFPVKAQLH